MWLEATVELTVHADGVLHGPTLYRTHPIVGILERIFIMAISRSSMNRDEGGQENGDFIPYQTDIALRDSVCSQNFLHILGY